MAPNVIPAIIMRYISFPGSAWERTVRPRLCLDVRCALPRSLVDRTSGAHGMVRDDPCHLAWQVKKIPWLEFIAIECKTPASSSGR